MPNSATPMRPAMRNEPPRLRSRSTRIGSSGLGERTSIRTNETSSTAARMNMVTATGEPHRALSPLPAGAAWVKPYTSAIRPRVEVIAPSTS